MSSSITQTTINHHHHRHRHHLHRLTTKILNSHSLQFTTTSLLFLLLTTTTITTSLLFLPLTISASTAVQLYISSTDTASKHDPFIIFLIKTIFTSSQTLLTFKTLITALPFACFIILPAIAGISFITFSSTLKPLSHSHIHFLYTLTVRSLKLIILLFIVTISSISLTEAIKALVFHLDQLFGPTANWILILQFGTMCLQSSLMIMQYVVENTVLYVHCMVGRGEKIMKTTVDEEVSGEYVRLVMDDEDDEEETNGGCSYSLFLLTIVWIILLCLQFYYIFIAYKNL